MKHNVTIWFMDGTTASFKSADRVEALNAGGGILSVIHNRKNSCFLMHFIERYEVEDVVSE